MREGSIKSSVCLSRRNPWYSKTQNLEHDQTSLEDSQSPVEPWLAWEPKFEHQALDHSFNEAPGLDAEKQVRKLIFTPRDNDCAWIGG